VNRKWLFLLVLAVVVAILGYRLQGWDFDWALFFSSLWNVKGGWLAASVILTLGTYAIRAFRWQVLLNPLKSISFASLLEVTLVGFCAIYVLGRAGELVRPVWLTRREQVPLTSSVATLIVERFFDSLMLIALFAWTLFVIDLPATAGLTVTLMKNAAWVMVAGSAGAIVFLFVFRSNIDRIVRHVRFPRIADLLHKFAQGLSFLQEARSLGLVAAHSAVLWIVIALQTWFLILGMNFDFSLEAATLVLVGAAIGSVAQIPAIGGGFQAGYVFCMTTFFQVPAEQAIATSLLAWFFSYAPTVIVAGIYMLVQGLSLKDLRAVEVSE
jgi:uncharacterized protein (TIRG00374 family)